MLVSDVKILSFASIPDPGFFLFGASIYKCVPNESKCFSVDNECHGPTMDEDFLDLHDEPQDDTNVADAAAPGTPVDVDNDGPTHLEALLHGSPG